MSLQACSETRCRNAVTWLSRRGEAFAVSACDRHVRLRPLCFGTACLNESRTEFIPFQEAPNHQKTEKNGINSVLLSDKSNRVQYRLWLLILFALSATLVPCVRGEAQVEDEEEVADVVAVAARPVWTDANFDQWVFQHHRNAVGARKQMKAQLTLHAEDINRVCELTDAQNKKLQLAGRGDIKRFFDSYEEIKKKFQLLKHDQQKINQIFQDISPLQMTIQAGLYHDGSFLHKSLRNTLSDDQFTQYATIARERRDFRHRAKIELTVAVLEQGIPLRDEQRQKLITLLVNETKPPRKSGRYDYYGIMYRLSRIPEEKLKPWLGDTQWKVLNKQLDQARGMEQWLKQSGNLPDDDEEDDDET